MSLDLVPHLPRLRRYARALAGDSHRADDLVQDTLERALLKSALWRPGSRLDAWLLTLMHNIFLNQLRSSRLEDATPMGELAVEPAERARQTDGIEIGELDAALQRIPAEQRAVLLLVSLEERSYTDAAEILGVPVGTVMSRLSRARERLRQLLAGEDARAPTLKVVK